MDHSGNFPGVCEHSADDLSDHFRRKTRCRLNGQEHRKSDKPTLAAGYAFHRHHRGERHFHESDPPGGRLARRSYIAYDRLVRGSLSCVLVSCEINLLTVANSAEGLPNGISERSTRCPAGGLCVRPVLPGNPINGMSTAQRGLK